MRKLSDTARFAALDVGVDGTCRCGGARGEGNALADDSSAEPDGESVAKARQW